MTNIIIGFIAFEHLVFLVIEMFFWKHPFGLKIFHNTFEKAQLSAALAANQGLYNGFLSAGLIWSLLQKNSSFSFQLKCFFLCCILIAGVYGALTANKNIFFIQALPALAVLYLLLR